jgi:hypothetical protein
MSLDEMEPGFDVRNVSAQGEVSARRPAKPIRKLEK